MDNRRRMMWKKPPEYAIYYTSTDGNVLTINTNVKWDDAQIVSNTYENNIGIIRFNKPVTKIPKTVLNNKSTLSGLYMPDTITSIDVGCFQNCINLTDVTFSAQLTKLPQDSFANCGFTSIVIPNNIVDIQTAFRGCVNLASVVLGNNVNKMGLAFAQCPIESIVLPKSVTDIDGAFSSLKRIYISDITQWLKFTFFSYSYNPCHSGNLDIYVNDVLLTELTIPDDITTINAYAFYNYKKLQKLHVGDSVIDIKTSAFYSNESLEEVSLGNNVILHSNPFSLCTGLKKINIKSLENWCQSTGFVWNDYPTKYTKNLWMDDIPITKVDLKNCTSINNYTLASCSGITKVIIRSNIKNVNQGAFDSDFIPEVYCDSIQTWCAIKWSSSPAYNGSSVYINGELIQDVVIPSNVTTFSSYIFTGWNNMKSIFLHENITNIYPTSFQHTYPEVHITSLDTWFKIDFGTGNLVNSLSENMTGLYVNGELQTNIIVPQSITEIRPVVFYGYKKLESIVIHDNVTSIGYRAFSDCSSLTSVTIGNSVTSIGSDAFYYCKLSSVTIPKNVVSIDSRAFNQIKALQYIYMLPETPPSLSSNVFTTNDETKIVVPFNSLNEYKTHWSNYAKYIVSGYTPTECTSLNITADHVTGNATTTTIYYTAITNGVDISGEVITNQSVSGVVTSENFPQNTSLTDTIERTITYTYMGITATTTITQGVWVNQGYELVLNDNWWLSTTVPNPDTTAYYGVYESYSNKGISSTAATMYIDIFGYSNFKLYIRSYAESNYDYVMVSQLDQTIDNNTSYSNTTLVKAHTRSKSTSTTTISGYTLVEFTGIDENAHRITIVYRKDGSGNSYDDRGYILIPKEQ